MTLGKKQQRVLIWGAAILFFLGMVYLFSRIGRQVSEPEPTSQPAAVPTPREKIDIREQQAAVERSRQTTPLGDARGGTLSGNATRSFNGERFLFSLVASLPQPGVGEYYEAWLESSTETPPFLSAGKLSVVDPGQYAVVFSRDRSLFGHNAVLVTLETADDGQPETHILEGTF